MDSKINKTAEAFKEGGNIVGLASVVATALALVNPIPLIVGLVAEATYLLFVPDSKWYDSRLSRKNDADVVLRRQQLRQQTFAVIDEDTQERFIRLESIRTQINTQVQKDQKWFLEVLRKLDYLLEKFLMFATKESEFRKYLVGVWQEANGTAKSSGQQQRRQAPGQISFQTRPANPPPIPTVTDERIGQMVADVQKNYDDDIAQLTTAMAKEDDANTKAVMQKRIEVIQQRKEGVGKIGRILTNLRYQLALVEDTFGLINDQIRARSPEQVLSDIEGVVYQTDSMTSLLEELAPYEQMGASV